MKIIRGLQNAIEVLVDGRGLNLNTVSSHAQERIAEVFGESLSPLRAVELILKQVREGGDEALRDLTRRLDGRDSVVLEVPQIAVDRAYRSIPDDLIKALELAATRICRFHEMSLPKKWIDSDSGYGELVNPVERVGAYVPGGTARYPSTVLMTAIPAKVAGVSEVIVATPGGEMDTPHPAVLVAADIAGVDKIFHIGGAQAIAAMVYGTETVPRVDMICGPGNIFVTLAKKLLFGEVGIDGLYGPTETLVIADDDANPTLCAADLVAQAEHDEFAMPVLITTSERLGDAVQKELAVRVDRLDRSATAKVSIERQGCIAIVEDLDEAMELSNRFAPEHLSLMVRDPWSHVDGVRNAGAVFIGEFSHEVLGDYVAGPSHVMPTGGTAKFGSGLSVRSFLKISPVIGLDEETSSALTKVASLIARAEGFTGHAEAAEIRDELLSS